MRSNAWVEELNSKGADMHSVRCHVHACCTIFMHAHVFMYSCIHVFMYSCMLMFMHAAICCMNSETRHESCSSKRKARISHLAGAEHKERLTSQASEFAKTFQEELKKGSEEIFKNPPPPPRK